jgi:hypothetical protein
MTTFTTEDRILAEKDGSFTVNVEPIPFAGWVETTKEISQAAYFTLTNDSQIRFTQEFEVLSGEQKLAALNRAMDLIMAKTGQVIDSLEVQ